MVSTLPREREGVLEKPKSKRLFRLPMATKPIVQVSVCIKHVWRHVESGLKDPQHLTANSESGCGGRVVPLRRSGSDSAGLSLYHAW